MIALRCASTFVVFVATAAQMADFCKVLRTGKILVFSSSPLFLLPSRLAPFAPKLFRGFQISSLTFGSLGCLTSHPSESSLWALAVIRWLGDLVSSFLLPWTKGRVRIHMKSQYICSQCAELTSTLMQAMSWRHHRYMKKASSRGLICAVYWNLQRNQTFCSDAAEAIKLKRKSVVRKILYGGSQTTYSFYISLIIYYYY